MPQIAYCPIVPRSGQSGCHSPDRIALLIPLSPDRLAPERASRRSLPARRLVVLLAVTAGVAIAAPPAAAEGLREALVQAYRTNPTLQSARADQRALDETVPIERADGLPRLSASGSFTEYLHDSGKTPTSPERQLSGQVSLGVPIYSGGAVRNSVGAAKSRIEAGRADLRGTESSVFSQVVAAYMDVNLSEAVVDLRRNLVKVLETDLRATTDRFEIGELTRTDVAQSEARLQLAKGDARSAEASLIAARESYIQLVGTAPGRLEPPPPLPNLPASPEEALAAALDSNPDLIAAKARTRAAERDVAVAGSLRLPRLELFGTGSGSDYLGTLGGSTSNLFDQSSTSASAGLRATIPLFQGGLPAALRRQSQARAAAAMEREIAMERDIVAQVRATYSSWQATNEIIASSQTAVAAAELSLQGVRAENSVGNRTVLDILNAEQELLQARVRLVTARSNAYVAGFSLLAAIGKAEARDLGLDGGPLYDPQINYERVRGKLFDWDDDPAPRPVSTRTVDSAPQDAELRDR